MIMDDCGCCSIYFGFKGIRTARFSAPIAAAVDGIVVVVAADFIIRVVYRVFYRQE